MPALPSNSSVHPSARASIAAFRFVTAPRIVFGEGESARLGTHASGLGDRVVMITDPGIVTLGLHERAAASLGERLVAIYDAVGPDPTRTMLEGAIERARESGRRGWSASAAARRSTSPS